MGFIYKFTALNGKIYIGQTTHDDPNKRFIQHKNTAIGVYEGKENILFYRAIRKYGWDNFKREILIECNDQHLDDYEIRFIHMYGSLMPNGYNMTIGGGGTKGHTQTVDTKQSRALSLKKDHNKGLPMYVKRRKSKNGEGYIVEKPGVSAIQFCSPDLSMEEKLKLAIDAINRINNGEPVEAIKADKEKNNKYPKYITYSNNAQKFIVRVPGASAKVFGGKSDSYEQKLQKAIECRNKIINDAVQRPNVDGNQN
jgi:group I intron endonuclease